MLRIFLLFFLLTFCINNYAQAQFISNCSTCGNNQINKKSSKTEDNTKNNKSTFKSISKWLNHPNKIKEQSIFGMDNFSVLMAKKPCPTNYRWFWNKNFSKGENKSYEKFKESMKNRLEGYPMDTIQNCSKLNYLIKQNQITNHLNNQENLSRTVATMIWEKEKSKKVFKVIVESNHLNNKPEGAIYNESLQKICSTNVKRLGNGISNVKLDCVGLSTSINVVANITDYKTGQFKAFGSGGGYKIFLTNYNYSKAKKKFPDIFKDVD